MSSTKHTPGPWRQSTANPNAVNKDGEKLAIGIATTHGTDDSNYVAFFPSTDEAKANAILIAAAPELLDALQRLIKECEWQAEIGNMNGERIEFGAARAAIAKATQP